MLCPWLPVCSSHSGLRQEEAVVLQAPFPLVHKEDIPTNQGVPLNSPSPVLL
jgi:hypothetical protein